MGYVRNALGVYGHKERMKREGPWCYRNTDQADSSGMVWYRPTVNRPKAFYSSESKKFTSDYKFSVIWLNL